MARRFNRVTGQYEDVAEDGTVTPVTDQSLIHQAGQDPPPEAAATPATGTPREVAPQSGFGSEAPQGATPTPYVGPYGTEPIRQAIGDRIANSAWGGVAGTANAAPSGSSPGSIIGADVGERGANPPAPLNFGDEVLPEDQQYIDALTNLQSTLGNPATITAPTLPEIPAGMFEPDPALQTLADHAARRGTQIDELIASLRQDQTGRLNRVENKWYLLGRWLSDWAATNDPTQAGAAMSRVIGQNDDMRNQLRQETLQLTQMGWSAEDAVIQAQANLLSGQAEARRAQAGAQYQRGTAQTQLDFGAQQTNAQIASSGATARANAAVSIAEAQREARQRARGEQNRVAEVLSNNPAYQQQAFGEIAGNITSDPATQNALTSTMAEQQQYSSLMNYIVSNQGQNNRQVLQFLRQWDPSLNENDLRRSPPNVLMMRLTRAPGAANAFARNRDALIRSAQFGGGAPSQ